MDLAYKQEISCRLYLNAVVPVISELLKHVPKALEIIGDHAFSILIDTPSKIGVLLSFRDGKCEVLERGSVYADIHVQFKNERNVVRFFTGGIAIPSIERGLSRSNKLFAFGRLAMLLKRYLEPSKEDLKDEMVRQLHLRFLLAVAMGGLRELAMHDEKSRKVLMGLPEGIALFHVEKQGLDSWVTWRNGEMKVGKGAPSESPDVIISFTRASLALSALNAQIDPFAALGLGEIKVKGLIPLADGVSYVIERLPLFLDI